VIPKSDRPSARSFTLLLAGIAVSGPVLLFEATPTDAADQPLTVHVSYAGLDLSSKAGAASLYRRLKGAAQDVCGSVDHRQLEQYAHWTTCYEKALADAVAQVNQPQVTALYRTQRHASTPG